MADSSASTSTNTKAASAEPSSSDLVDVIVVGAGPVGMLLACLLVQRGLSVTVLESRAHGSEHSRAIGIHPPGLSVLAQAGLADAAIAAGTPIFRGEAWCDGEILGGLDIREANGRYPFVLSLPQRETERLLAARFEQLCAEMANEASSTLKRGTHMLGVVQRGEHIEVSTRGGPTLRARYVVGADGPRSQVRDRSGIRWSAMGAAQPYVMGDFVARQAIRLGREGTPLAATTALLAFERGGVVESFPLPGGWRRWVALTDRLLERASAAGVAGIVRDRLGIGLLSEQQTAEDRARTEASISVFAVRQHLAGSMVAERVALVGDAAHEVSPIGGQGMNLGWLDAAALASAIEVGVRGGRELGARALHDYDVTRRRAAKRAVLQASFNMGVGQPARGARLRARNAVVRALARPPFRALLAQAFTMRGL